MSNSSANRMNNSQKTLSSFYSQNNIKLLYDTLRRAIKESLHYELTGDEYIKQLASIMQNKVQSMGNNIPNSIQELNKQTLDDAIPMFIRSIRSPRQQSQQRQQQSQQIPHYPVQVSQQPVATQQQYPNHNGSMEHLFNQLVEQRTPQQQQQMVPNFADPEPQHQPDVNQIYQLEDQRRQQSDLIPPPDPRTVSMLPPNVANNIRHQPTSYGVPSGGQLRDYQTHENNHNGQHLSQNGSRDQQEFYYNTPPMTPPQMATPPANVQNYNFESQAQSMTDYDARNDMGTVPQPREMRVLIPEASRGIVTPSDMIPQLFSVDSRDRDENIYPDPADYRIRLPEFKNVISIQLVAAEVPITGYVVNETNNILHYQEEDGITLQAVVPVGNYSPDDLATAIETAMTSGFGVTYSVSNNPITNTFTIAASGGAAPVFNLIFFGGTVPFNSSNEPNQKEMATYETGSIGPIIGFDKVDLTGATSYTGQFRYNLGGDKNLYLHVKEADLIHSNNSNVHKAFAKMPIDVPLGGTIFYRKNEDYPFIKHYSAEVGRLSHLTIQWKKYDGSFYDFNGHNHTLTFEIITKDFTKPKY